MNIWKWCSLRFGVQRLRIIGMKSTSLLTCSIGLGLVVDPIQLGSHILELASSRSRFTNRNDTLTTNDSHFHISHGSRQAGAFSSAKHGIHGSSATHTQLIQHRGRIMVVRLSVFSVFGFRFRFFPTIINIEGVKTKVSVELWLKTSLVLRIDYTNNRQQHHHSPQH
jgi:hypothetical protein